MSITQDQADDNKRKVAEAMRIADQVRQGGKLTEGELIEFESLEGNHYKGYIVFKKPNMGDIMRMGAKKADTLKSAGVTDPNLVDDHVMMMATMMATLEVVCVKRPDWFMNIEEITEPELIYHIYARYQRWENSFRKDLRGEPSDNNKDGEGTAAMDTSEARIPRNTTD